MTEDESLEATSENRHRGCGRDTLGRLFQVLAALGFYHNFARSLWLPETLIGGLES